MKYWCEHPWRGRFENARAEELCAKCGRPTDAPYIDTATAIERFRNGKSIFTPPTELAAAISNAIRATGKLNDFEVTALVRAGVMKKVHLRHPREQEEAACGQPYASPSERSPARRRPPGPPPGIAAAQPSAARAGNGN